MNLKKFTSWRFSEDIWASSLMTSPSSCNNGVISMFICVCSCSTCCLASLLSCVKSKSVNKLKSSLRKQPWFRDATTGSSGSKRGEALKRPSFLKNILYLLLPFPSPFPEQMKRCLDRWKTTPRHQWDLRPNFPLRLTGRGRADFSSVRKGLLAVRRCI